MTEDLDEMLDAVVDRDSFLAFVKALIVDRQDEVAKEKENPSSPYGAGANGWEHGTIESYLDAAVAWMENSQGTAGELPAEPSWKSFATFLYRGKSYE
jgi:hypothetical protein